MRYFISKLNISRETRSPEWLSFFFFFWLNALNGLVDPIYCTLNNFTLIGRNKMEQEKG